MVRTVAVAIQDAWDRYASLMYYPVTLLLFSLVVLFNWWYGEKLAADWEQWTEMAFPESGTYVVPGALVPVEIDRDRDAGLYVEPNVWMVHASATARP